jgi:inner membrane protein
MFKKRGRGVVSPFTHFLASWVVAELGVEDRRSRLAICVAGVAPDLDGLGAVVDVVNHWLGYPGSEWFFRYHHLLLHGLLGALLVLGGVALCGLRSWRVLGLCLLTFHLHLLCDVVGSRGPTAGDLWVIHYWAPMTLSGGVAWTHQWALNAWPNFVLTAGLICWVLMRVRNGGVTPVSLVSGIAERKVVEAVRGFGKRI